MHTLACRKYGTNIVGGRDARDAVAMKISRIPVFDTDARGAVEKTGANTHDDLRSGSRSRLTPSKRLWTQASS